MGISISRDSDGLVVYVPAKRIDSATGIVGRVIEAASTHSGSVLPLSSIETGRQILLSDAGNVPAAAEVTSAAFVGLNVSVATTGADLTTAIELKLDSEHSRQVLAWRSADLPTIGSESDEQPAADQRDHRCAGNTHNHLGGRNRSISTMQQHGCRPL